MDRTDRAARTDRGIVLAAPGTVAVESIAVGEPAAGEAVLAVDAAGVCGSDVAAYRDEPGYGFIEHPRRLGHEYAGTVVAVGDDVAGIEPGDRCVDRPLRACGRCRQCRHDQPHVCRNVRITGFHEDGGFATRTRVPADSLLTVPDDLPPERAAVAEPLAVARRATVVRGAVAPADRVLVQGPGPMGAFSALVAARTGASVRLVGLPGDRERLAAAEATGLRTAVVDPDGPDGPTVASSNDGGGYDLVVDATGAADGVAAATRAVRKGGRVVLLGIPGAEPSIDAAALVRGEIDLLASYGATRADFAAALRLLDALDDRLDPLLAWPTDPTDPTAAFERFAARDVCKPVFRVAGLRVQ